MTTPLNPSARIPFLRLLSGHDRHCYTGGPSLLLQHRVTGRRNIVYQAGGVIIKTPFPPCESDFEREAKIHQYLMQTNASRFIPTFYGYFGHRNTRFIILSDEGTALEDFDGLSEQSRYVPVSQPEI
jgi:hypothetical protein